MTRRTKKSGAQLDREIAAALARSAGARKKTLSGRESPSAWASTAAAIVVDRVRASEAYRLGRQEIVRAAAEAAGPSPTVARLKELGGLTKIVGDQIAIASTPGLDENLGSPMFPHTPRVQLRQEVGALRAEVQHLLQERAWSAT